MPNRFLKLSKCSCLLFVNALLFHFASKQIIHDLLASEVSPNIRSIGSLSLQGCLSPLVMRPLLPFAGASCCASSSVFHLPWSFGLAPLLILSPRRSSWLILPTPGGSSNHLPPPRRRPAARISSSAHSPWTLPLSSLPCCPLLGSVLVSSTIICRRHVSTIRIIFPSSVFSVHPFSCPLMVLSLTPLSAFWIAITWTVWDTEEG